jgi:hypothetical protein
MRCGGERTERLAASMERWLRRCGRCGGAPALQQCRGLVGSVELERLARARSLLESLITSRSGHNQLVPSLMVVSCLDRPPRHRCSLWFRSGGPRESGVPARRARSLAGPLLPHRPRRRGRALEHAGPFGKLEPGPGRPGPGRAGPTAPATPAASVGFFLGRTAASNETTKKKKVHMWALAVPLRKVRVSG